MTDYKSILSISIIDNIIKLLEFLWIKSIDVDEVTKQFTVTADEVLSTLKETYCTCKGIYSKYINAGENGKVRCNNCRKFIKVELD